MNTQKLLINSKELLAIGIIFSSCISYDASACDDKSCESAYLSETTQHVANHVRRAEAFKAERHAYSRNKERRAYALHGNLPEQKKAPSSTALFQSASL